MADGTISNITSGGDVFCNFTDIQDFFDQTIQHGLNITQQIELCPNLCILTFGNGNPDLSGIGMMYAYSFQVALTLIYGPIFRFLDIMIPRLPWKSRFRCRDLLKASIDIQITFWESNTFLILASAAATLVRMKQRPTIFEIAEMQILAFVQLNSLLIIFFCLIHPITRWWQRFLQFLVGFGLATAALSQSRLAGAAEVDWAAASLGCQNQPAFRKITPIPYSRAVVFTAAGLCIVSFVAQTLTTVFPSLKKKTGSRKWILTSMAVLWGLLTTLSTAGMIWGLVILWQQRNQLVKIAVPNFEDNEWGFGQVAALFTWLPIPIELSYAVNDWLKERSTTWSRFQNRLAPYNDTKDGAANTDNATPMAPATTAVKGEREPMIQEMLRVGQESV